MNPARTALFPLAPCGVGTAEVEALTSYLRRLSERHVVSAPVLARQILLEPIRARRRTSGLLTNPATAGNSLCGGETTAALLVAELERATGRDDLSHLTFMPLESHVALRWAFRDYRAWCPACLTRSGYDRLSWTLRVNKACPVHAMLLIENCGTCGAHERPLQVRANATRCGACGAQLSAAVPMAAGEGELRAARLIHALIEYVQRPDGLPDQAIPIMLENARVRVGSWRSLAIKAGLSRGEISAIRLRRVRPTLSTVVKVVAATDRSLESLLIPREISAARPSTRSLLGGSSLDAALLRRIPVALQAAAEITPIPPPAHAIARAQGVSRGVLRRHFPAELRNLVTRRRIALAERRRDREAREDAAALEAVGTLQRSGRALTDDALSPLLPRGLLRVPRIRKLVRRARGARHPV